MSQLGISFSSLSFFLNLLLLFDSHLDEGRVWAYTGATVTITKCPLCIKDTQQSFTWLMNGEDFVVAAGIPEKKRTQRIVRRSLFII